ncbi:MAG: carbohydrate binding family 9 domain-containing protein [Alteromonadaceae bacterium]|nr:carbohydrate binding family 9 domain-containing protein [Alteromonadaceae bacterium]
MLLLKNKLIFILSTLFFLTFFCQLSFAQTISLSTSKTNNTQKIITIPHIQGKVTIDAQLNESQWQHATKVLVNNVTRPFDNIPSPVNTEAFIMADNENLYLAFIAQDPDPSKIRAYLKDRDQSWGEDIVGIKIDTYNDQRSAYRFLVNPLGVQMDGIENEITKKDSNAWDGIWSSFGKITKQGYVVEMALPLRMLNFKEDLPIQSWGIELLRFYPRKQFLRLSNIYLDRANSCEICQLAIAQGFAGAKQGNNLIITPSMVIGAKDNLPTNSENKQWQREYNTEPSLDIRWGITPDILLNTTINPDFSTVETDSAQLSINNNFALFFQEKRPFFLDNADYFDSDYNLIYTRNINAPNIGAKLTARQNDHSFALFLTDDKNTNILIPGNRSSNIATIEQSSKAAVIRYRYNYNSNITLGWTSTLRSSLDYNNQVHGIDGRFRLNSTDVIKFQSLYSKTQYPQNLFEQFCQAENPQDCQTPLNLASSGNKTCDLNGCDINENVLRTLKEQPFSGNAFKIGYFHTDDKWFYRLNYNRRNAGFRGDLGFIAKIDQNDFSYGLSHRWYGEENQWWTQFKIATEGGIGHNDNNELIERRMGLNLQLRANYDSSVRLGIIHRNKVGRRFDKSLLTIEGNTTLFTLNNIQLNAQIKPWGNLNLSSRLSYGDAIDFSSDRLGTEIRFVPSVNWNINSHWELRLRHTFSQLNADNANINNNNVFNARLSDVRSTYQFNLRSFIRFTLIYNNTDKNPLNYLYSNPDDITAKKRNLSTELLYAYKLNSQTVFYLGYIDHSDTTGDFSEIERDQRSIFMKFSYAWLG